MAFGRRGRSKATKLDGLLEEARKARQSGDATRLRGLAFELEQITREVPDDDDDPQIVEARSLSAELEQRRREIEASLRRRVATPCIDCGCRDMLLSEPASWADLYFSSRKLHGLRFRIVVCRGCGRTDFYAQEPSELAKDHAFAALRAGDDPDEPYR